MNLAPSPFYKTKICRNLHNCSFGEHCNFAHTMEEMEIIIANLLGRLDSLEEELDMQDTLLCEQASHIQKLQQVLAHVHRVTNV